MTDIEPTVYGCTSADFTSRNGRPVPNAVYTAWTAEIGGSPVTGLLALDMTPLDPIVSDDDGGVRFRDPRRGRDPIWIDTGWGRRVAVRPLNIDGESAYEIAVAQGFEGSEAAWLESLHAAEPKFTASATAVAAGGTPTAVVTGTYPNLSIDLGLPTGAQGPIGSGGPMSDLVVVDTTKQNSIVAAGSGNAVEKIVSRDTNPVSCHVSGYNCRCYGQTSDASGSGAWADGKLSHAEGNNCVCTGNDSHAEGNLTGAGRRYYTGVTTGSEDAGSGLGVLQYVLLPAAEGDVTSYFPNPLTDNVTTRYGAGAQIDAKGNVYAAGNTPAVWSGDTPTTPNDLSWAMHPVAILRGGAESEKAFVTIAKAVYSGGQTKVYYTGAKPFTTINGVYASYAPQILSGGVGMHSEGMYTSAAGFAAHAEGNSTRAWGTGTHAEGEATRATGARSHAEGYNSVASGAVSHAEGYATVASGVDAHAEGNYATASGDYSHAEGDSTTASGARSHAQGYSTVASGDGSHAEGWLTTASGDRSRAAGFEAVASRAGQDAWATGKHTTAGDNQVSRIMYTREVANAGWHAIYALRAPVNNRTYLFRTTVIGRQTAGTAGAVGNSFAYTFEGAFTMASDAITVLGTITRTLLGRTAGMTGDGLTTGPRLSAYTTIYQGDLVLRFDGEADTTFAISTHTTFQELA